MVSTVCAFAKRERDLTRVQTRYCLGLNNHALSATLVCSWRVGSCFYIFFKIDGSSNSFLCLSCVLSDWLNTWQLLCASDEFICSNVRSILRSSNCCPCISCAVTDSGVCSKSLNCLELSPTLVNVWPRLKIMKKYENKPWTYISPKSFIQKDYFRGSLFSDLECLFGSAFTVFLSFQCGFGLEFYPDINVLFLVCRLFYIYNLFNIYFCFNTHVYYYFQSSVDKNRFVITYPSNKRKKRSAGAWARHNEL